MYVIDESERLRVVMKRKDKLGGVGTCGGSRAFSFF